MPASLVPGGEPAEKILVIDDKPDNLRLLMRVLTEAGYTTLIAKNGESGLEKAALAKPELILLDIMMPGDDGFTICRKLKDHPETQRIPVIFMSALADIESKLKGFAAGAEDYIAKPFQQEEVLARVRTHLRLFRLQRDLTRRNHELDAFTRMVAHDLKNPLSSILFFSEELQHFAPGQTWTEEQQQEIRQIHVAADKMHGLIHALLTYARIGKDAMHPGPLDSAAVVRQIWNIRLRGLRDERGGRLELPAEWPVVEGHLSWVEEIWANLLSNALKYGGEDPLIQVAIVHEPLDQVRFMVRDHGLGLTPEMMDRLFQPFTRFHKEHAEGHGLGLSIVQELVTRSGGVLEVESTPGEGSEFRFTLPLYREEDETSERSEGLLPLALVDELDRVFHAGDLEKFIATVESLVQPRAPELARELRHLAREYRIDALSSLLHNLADSN